MKEDYRSTSKPEPTSEPKEAKEETLFNLKQIDFNVPRGQLLAIVGVVGSGKTSLLQGLVGDMRKTEGSVRFGGSLAYCSQSAWIQVSFPARIIVIQWVKPPTECHYSGEHLLWSALRGCALLESRA